MSIEPTGIGWRPPQRPEWLARMNQEGSYMDLEAVVPLDEASLLDAARRRTGLSDFGDDSNWRESFQHYVKGLNEEARLNLMGRLMSRSDLINILSARLQIQETYRQHPEIDEQEISAPIMIMGQARTGTSLLLNVLSQDPDNAVLRHWECMTPCPPPNKDGYFEDPRIVHADRLVEQWNRVNPELVSCHEFNALVPTEASHALTLNFTASPYLALIGQVPSHVFWQYQNGGLLDGLRYQKRLLKLLQWKNPRKHWVLKSPDAITFMPELLKVYPDLRFVWTHRDPVKAGASVLNMYGQCMWIRSDEPMQTVVLDAMLNPDLAGATLTQPIEWMEQGLIAAESVCNLLFFDLEQDPVRAVERIYGQFGMDFTPAARKAMNDYLRANPRSARPPATYQADDPRFAVEHPAIRRYREYFSVPREL